MIRGRSGCRSRRLYFEGVRKLSDKNFLVMPEEEVNSYFDGHWYLMTPKPVYFTHPETRAAGQPFKEDDPKYGTVYHLGSADDDAEVRERDGEHYVDGASADEELGAVSGYV